MAVSARKSWIWLAVLGLGLGAGLGALLRTDSAHPSASEAHVRSSEPLHATPQSGAPATPVDPRAASDPHAAAGGESAAPVAGRSPATSALDAVPGSPLPWHRTLDSARAAARGSGPAGSGKLILAYLGVDPRHCPPCARMDAQLFRGPQARQLLEHVVLWRGRVDAADFPADDRARVAAWGVEVLPALLVLTPELGVLHRQHARLYPAYTRDYEPLGRLAHELSLFELIGILEEAGVRARREAAQLDALAREQGRDALIARSRVLAGQERWLEAIDALEGALLREPSDELQAELAGWYKRAGQWGRAVGLLRTIETQVRGTTAWGLWERKLLRLEFQNLGSDTDSASRRALLRDRARALVTHFEANNSADEAARTRLLLAEILAADGNMEAVQLELPALERHAAISPGASLSACWLWRLAQLERRVGAFRLAHGFAQRIFDEHPASMEAQLLKHGVLDEMRREAVGTNQHSRPY